MSGNLLLQLTSQEQERVEAWLVAFDQAWHVGALAEWSAKRLPDPGDPLRPLVLTELVKIDLERQWQAGHRLTLGSYLERFPELGSLETVSPELILAEFRVRRQFGVAVDVDDYARRFPHQAEALVALVERDAATSDRKSSNQPLGPSAERDTSHSAGVSCTVDAAPEAANHSASDLPETFGRYRVLKKLGQGGMGAVYLAHDTQLDRDVALKIPTFSQREGREVVDRFLREARAAATIHHPNLCPVYDVGQIDGVHFMTMAYIEGRPLSEYIRQGKPVTERQAATVVRAVALALQEAHARGIVHRDIKPSNIMINTRNEPVIMDFGLARRNEREEVALTRSGALLGTPAYMAPEQARGLTEAIGPCSDIFSLGVILYELLAGRRPFRGELIEVLSQILTAEPEPPTVHRPGLDPQLEGICLKAMAKRPADRFGSAKEMATALQIYLRGTQKTAGAGPAVQPSSTLAPAVASASPVAGAASVPSAQTEPSQPRSLLPPDPLAERVASPLIASAVAPPRFAPATPATSAPAVSLGKPSISVGKGRRTPGKKRGAPRRNLPPWTWIVAGSAALVLLVSLGIVLLLSTPEGTVRIEIEDPQADVQVAVDGRNIDIAGLGEPLRLAVGDHQLVVDGQDIQLHTQSFTIRRGKNPPVRVALIPRSAETPAAHFPASTTPASQPIARGMVSGQLKHASKVMSLAFSPDGSILAAGDEGGEVRLWDTASGQEIKRLPIGKSVFELAFHPQGRMLAAGGWRRGEAGTVHIWTVPDGQSVKSFSNQAGLRKPMTFSRDGLTLFSSNTEGEIVLWDVDTAAERGRLPGHGAVVTCLATSPNGQLLASGGRDRSVRVWEIATRQQRQSFSYTVNPGDVTADINFVGFYPDSRHVVFGAKADLIKGDISSGSRVWSGRRHIFSANRGTISPDAQYVLSSGGEGDSDHVVFSALTDGQKSRTLRGYKGAWDVAFHPSGKLLATAGPDNSIKLWDTATWEEVRQPIALEAVRVEVAPSPVVDAPDFRPLLNRSDLTGWTPTRTTGPNEDVHLPTTGGWSVVDGEIICATNEAGWLKSDRQYGDFELQLEFRLPPGGNSGIYLRSPDQGRLSDVALEVQILDEQQLKGMPPEKRTGSLFGIVGPAVSALKPAGEWNAMTIRCEGDRYQVTLNGTRVVETDANRTPALAGRPRSGFLGLSNWHGSAQGAAFRNIRIRELDSPSLGEPRTRRAQETQSLGAF
ncbi:MAG: DUF1080 domain-containing protein [Pirellulaceae bacterium]|nr:DUF1080 domain-containing protein [Pirellulaceae bacterium]